MRQLTTTLRPSTPAKFSKLPMRQLTVGFCANSLILLELTPSNTYLMTRIILSTTSTSKIPSQDSSCSMLYEILVYRLSFEIIFAHPSFTFTPLKFCIFCNTNSIGFAMPDFLIIPASCSVALLPNGFNAPLALIISRFTPGFITSGE